MINNPRAPRLLTASALAIALSFSVSTVVPSFAASSGGGNSGSTVNCRDGWTYNKKTKACEPPSLLEDEALIEQGRDLALAGHYENALNALMAVRDKDDATALTYIGYATRKMGKVDEGIDWYHKALAVEPDNLYTREYLGEGYVASGRIDLAEEQLAQLETLCGKACEQYEALAAAIAGEPERWGS